MKVYELMVKNEDGNVFTSLYSSMGDAETMMCGEALYDMLFHIYTGVRSEEIEYVSNFLDSIKEQIAKDDRLPSGSFVDILMKNITEQTGIKFGITEKEVK